MIFQLNPIITLLILDRLAYSLPKNITTFHRKEDMESSFFVSVPIKWVFWHNKEKRPGLIAGTVNNISPKFYIVFSTSQFLKILLTTLVINLNHLLLKYHQSVLLAAKRNLLLEKKIVVKCKITFFASGSSVGWDFSGVP